MFRFSAAVNIGCRRAILCLVQCLLLVATAAEAAPGIEERYNIRIWETDEGLPQSSVLAITQTRDGYLWLGTLSGLVRFDGMRFTVFDSRNTPALADSRIVALYADSSGALWIGTESAGTVVLRDGRFSAPPELSLGGADRMLIGGCEDANGAVWLCNANGELWRYSGQRFTGFVLTPHEPSDRRSIIREPNGPVWVSTETRQVAVATDGGTTLELPTLDEIRGRIDRLVPSGEGGYWRLADLRVQRWITNRMERDYLQYPWPRPPVAACEDKNGNLVVGTFGSGVYVVDRNDGSVSTISTNDGLSHSYILSVFEDREGTLWVGTDGGGLNRVQRKVFNVVPPTHGWVVQSVAHDTNGGVWIGSNLEGLSHWYTNEMRRYYDRSLRPVRAVFVDSRERVWVGPGAGVWQLRAGRFQTVATNHVLAIHEDARGHVWFGGAGLLRLSGEEWRHFTAEDGLSTDIVTALASDGSGLWVGTRRSGLFEMRDEKLRSVEHTGFGEIAGLLVDDEGTLWITTQGNGLVRHRDGKWTRYSTAEGLVSNTLGYIMDDGRGELWIGANAGVLRLRKKELNEVAEGKRNIAHCRAYGRSDGLPTAECTSGSQPGGMRDRTGRLWFPTIRGLAYVDPQHFLLNTNPPPVRIEAVSLDGRPVTHSGRLTLQPGDERLEIFYTSLNLTAPHLALFRYRLAGHENEWIEAGNTRVVRYTRLPPGEYTFHVTACNEDGVWNEVGSKLAITVLPPIWRTWWFLTAMALLVIAAVAGAVHLASTQRLKRELVILRHQEALEKERARIARDIHDQVGASLTQVALLGELVESDKDSPPDIEAHAQQICQTARETTRALDEIVWTVNPSNDTLEGLVNYICKYAQDYLGVAGIRYRLDVPSEMPAAAIPPDVRHNVFLASKEAITNIVRHANATSAWIRVRVSGGTFVVEVEDDGKGLAGLDPKAARTRHGLSNMRKRMEDIGGQFELEPGRERGAIVRLTVPLMLPKVES